MGNMYVGAVFVTRCCFIDRMLRLQHLGDKHSLQPVIDTSLVPYAAQQGGSGCHHVVPSPADSSQKGVEPPGGAICILDKVIHHPRGSTQFRVLLPTAPGSEQLCMFLSVMRALQTCLVALIDTLNGWRKSMSQSLGLIPLPSSRVVPNAGSPVMRTGTLNLEDKTWYMCTLTRSGWWVCSHGHQSEHPFVPGYISINIGTDFFHVWFWGLHFCRRAERVAHINFAFLRCNPLLWEQRIMCKCLRSRLRASTTRNIF